MWIFFVGKTTNNALVQEFWYCSGSVRKWGKVRITILNDLEESELVCQSDMLKEAEESEMNMLKMVPTTTPPCLRFCMFSCKQGKVLKKWERLLSRLSTKDPEKQNNGANAMNIEKK